MYMECSFGMIEKNYTPMDSVDWRYSTALRMYHAKDVEDNMSLT